MLRPGLPPQNVVSGQNLIMEPTHNQRQTDPVHFRASLNTNPAHRSNKDTINPFKPYSVYTYMHVHPLLQPLMLCRLDGINVLKWQPQQQI